jgi:hypothetical protein
MRAWLPLLLCPLFSGCFGFAYPSITETPSTAIAEKDVRAFRKTSGRTFYGALIAGAIGISDEVEEIPILEATVAPQTQTYFAYGFIIFPLFGVSESRSLRVVLYRPGYEAVELPARAWWRSIGAKHLEDVQWKPAVDLEAQMHAVDAVVLRSWKDYVGNPKVLKFAAQEYARLAQSPLAAASQMREIRDKLLAAARECEELAAKRTE